MRSHAILFIATMLIAPISALPLSPRAACSSDVQKLVDGINSNIAVQKMEQSQAGVLANILSASPVDQDKFKSAKSKMVDIVNQGITIRKNNQKITPSDNGATAGLAKVATAQSAELKLASGLTADSQGSKDVSTLKTDFAGGIKQNQQNAKDAAAGCTAKRDISLSN